MANQHRVGSTATHIAHSAGTITVTYHATTVVTADSASITLNSGGWRTSTTKTRMNQASQQYGLGYLVYAKAGSWFVDYGGETFAFSDGMRLAR